MIQERKEGVGEDCQQLAFGLAPLGGRNGNERLGMDPLSNSLRKGPVPKE